MIVIEASNDAVLLAEERAIISEFDSWLNTTESEAVAILADYREMFCEKWALYDDRARECIQRQVIRLISAGLKLTNKKTA